MDLSTAPQKRVSIMLAVAVGRVRRGFCAVTRRLARWRVTLALPPPTNLSTFICGAVLRACSGIVCGSRGLTRYDAVQRSGINPDPAGNGRGSTVGAGFTPARSHHFPRLRTFPKYALTQNEARPAVATAGLAVMDGGEVALSSSYLIGRCLRLCFGPCPCLKIGR
jgi:hypothetical protein